jgi:hypothetical protein
MIILKNAFGSGMHLYNLFFFSGKSVYITLHSQSLFLPQQIFVWQNPTMVSIFSYALCFGVEAGVSSKQNLWQKQESLRHYELKIQGAE